MTLSELRFQTIPQRGAKTFTPRPENVTHPKQWIRLNIITASKLRRAGSQVSALSTTSTPINNFEIGKWVSFVKSLSLPASVRLFVFLSPSVCLFRFSHGRLEAV